MGRKLSLALVMSAAFWLLSPVAVVACPNCKEAVSASEGQVANMASGYNWSVLFMIAMPFSMFGTGAFVVHRAVKRGTMPEM
jgi:hypothetical protein